MRCVAFAVLALVAKELLCELYVLFGRLLSVWSDVGDVLLSQVCRDLVAILDRQEALDSQAHKVTRVP